MVYIELIQEVIYEHTGSNTDRIGSTPNTSHSSVLIKKLVQTRFAGDDPDVGKSLQL